MKKLPAGQPIFRQIIEGNNIYVDKTEWIYRLLIEGQFFFFPRSRRRFGKSLLTSTLNELFLGSKEFFKGLWIYDKYDFKRHPLIFISFVGIDYWEASFIQAIHNQLDNLATGAKSLPHRHRFQFKRTERE